ncbi:MAG: type II secretion system secretin GspD [Caulobacter sp.]|nr:type II secretion system secretin GspD [Caulobacter sp.]
MLALLLIASSAPLAAVRPALAAAAADTYTFAFRDADIAQVAEEILGVTLGLTYTIDPSVSGKMSFRVERRMTRAQLLEAFEGALGNNGVVMIRQGESLLLTARANAKASGGVQSSADGVSRAGYSVVAVPLDYAAPSEVAKVLQSVGPANVVLEADDKTGVLLLGGTGREIEAALSTIKVFDRSSLQGARMRWFELSQASAPSVAGEINQILQASGTAGATVVPLRRLNGIIAFARSTGTLDEVGGWVERLDKSSGEQASTLWVYHPLNVSAESLAATLASVTPGGGGYSAAAAPAGPAAGQAGAAAPPVTAPTPNLAPVVGEEAIRIGVDRESNSLLISASPADRVRILKVLEEIDVTPSQVLIEASILEVTLTDGLSSGVNWSVLGDAGRLKIISTSDAAGGIAPTLPGLAVTFIGDDIKAAIDALAERTAVEVISTPKIVTLNNRTATLQIGDQVPVVIQTAQSNVTPDAPRVVNVEYRDTGVILTVTPRVSGDAIMLTIAQEVSSVAKTTTSGIDSPTIQQRRFESTLMLRDGQAVALGGLISSTRSNGDSGVPYIKDVPGLGRLFKSQERDQRRTELIVLITARIMRGEESSARVMTDLMDDLKEITSRGLLSR